MFYVLSIKNANTSNKDILWKCYKVCFEGQFKFRMSESSKTSPLYNSVKTYLGIASETFFITDSYKFNENEAYVLTDSRTEFVETVLACIECNIPVLLEGKMF